MTSADKSIVLVDDDKFLLDMYSMKFTQAGWHVQACLSVKDALEALRGGLAPDAIAFDLVMPDMDGFALLQKLKEENLAKGAKLVALTNQSDETEQKKAMELGADRYIIKASMIPSEVVAAIGEELGKK